MAWVNLVEADEAFRGRGYGREAMLLAEAEARGRGMRSIGLKVHGSNAAARSLYASLGYDVITQQMKKSLQRRTRTGRDPPSSESDGRYAALGRVTPVPLAALKASGSHRRIPSDCPAMVLPVGLAQPAPEQLAARVAGHLVNEVDRLRPFHPRQPAVQRGEDLGG